MSIYGPEYKTSKKQNEVDLSVYGKQQDVLLKAGGMMRIPINMTDQRIVNLRDPVRDTDTATKRYIEQFTNFMHNTKVDNSGGIMTGNLNMSDNKITNVGDPEDETDAINKRYVDEWEQEPYGIGRYIVFPRNNNNIYFSVRTKKDIDLVNNLSFEMINTGRGDDSFDFINNDSRLAFKPIGDKYFTIASRNYSKPWTMLFSSKTEDSSVIFNACRLEEVSSEGFLLNLYRGVLYIFLYFDDNTKNIEVGLYTKKKFNHFALESIDDKFSIWINGKSKKTLNVNICSIDTITFENVDLKVLSIYNRNLDEFEIAEHFVEYQIKGSPNNKVLI